MQWPACRVGQHNFELSCNNILLPSKDFKIVDDVYTTTVKSEKNASPEFGPTEYLIRIEHAPDVRRRGRGRGARRKNELDKPFTCNCSCPAFDGMCKHLAAELMENF